MTVLSSASRQSDLYLAAFIARCDVARPFGQAAVEKAGLLGLLPSTEHPVARLLVTDDRAYDLVAGLLGTARVGMITVFAGATRCRELVDRAGGWRPDAMTALIHRDIGTIPAAPLPSELRFRPVRRLHDDSPDAATGGRGHCRDPG